MSRPRKTDLSRKPATRTARFAGRRDVHGWLLEALKGTQHEETHLSPAVARLTYVLKIIQQEWVGERERLSGAFLIATAIDSLFVKLGLDPKRFTQGQREAVEEFRRTAQSMADHAKRVERIPLPAWEAWGQDGVWPAQRGTHEQNTRWRTLDNVQSTRWRGLDVAQLPEDQRRLDELRENKRRADAGLRHEGDLTADQLKTEIPKQEREIERRKRTIAERDVRECALRAVWPILNKPEVGKHFVEELIKIFCAEFPGSRMEAAAHRFIALFVRHVTGEDVKPGTLKRFVNRSLRPQGDKP